MKTSRITGFVALATILVAARFAIGFEPVKTKTLRVGSPAQELSVDVTGVDELYLVADYGGDSYDCDQAIWGDPKLIDSDGNEIDLTTLEPESSRTGWGNLIVGKNHMGEPLKVRATTFKTGFWAHAPSQLCFKLDGKYRRFVASVGLDPHAERGSVVFEVRDKPVPAPSEAEYKKVDPSRKTPPIPKVGDASVQFNPKAARRLLDSGIESLLFLRHHTYNSNHVYTDHVNCDWLPGAGFCVLDLKTGEARDLFFDELRGGMILNFDISYDAKKIVFDYRASPEGSYRIYSANLDGTGLRRLTEPVEDEAELIRAYRRGTYMHGTDDMHPCWLPDGGIAFVSTRARFSVLCDASDNFTVTNLYRMSADGSDLRPLTYSALNEWCPAVLPDGRILYHRWEYVDKAAGNAKALWAINPDGTGPSEIYGDNVSFPESMWTPRPIPDSDNKIVFLGASHCCPNNALGTVIVIDAKEDARDPETMRYITDDVRTYHHNGFHFRDENGEYRHDMTGIPGRLFKDPYPVSEELFIASRKPEGLPWNDPTGYDLVLLDDEGAEEELFADETASCWHAVPMIERDVPPVRSSAINENLASQNLAELSIADASAGARGVDKGSVKYIRVLEQVPRSWSARKSWGEDHEGTTHAHSAVANGSLSVKVQLGIVPVEEDGSARFYVPADRAIYFQALDEKYRAIQTERTYVNYRPGESRACVGCHETQSEAPLASTPVTPIALTKEPRVLEPQPGQESAAFAFDYDRQIQPIWNARCVSCHDGKEDSPAPDMRGDAKGVYSISYWNLVALGNSEKELLGNRAERNEDAASNGIEFIEPYRTGTLSSPLGAWLFGDETLRDAPDAARAELEKLREVHKDASVQLSDAELLKIANWLDVNAPYHPSYFGRLHEKFQGRLDYRPEVSVDEARSRSLPERIRALYEKADEAAK
ncbi:MAG: NPCBM/NEW2 domain-containing protein [Thermoguttaceae bacterium]|nr:NPCBM/NEW2 domain-containing protein [Thermoguttaceae bacterium]